MRLHLLLLLLFAITRVSAQDDQIVHKRNKYIYTGEHKLFKTRYDSIRNFSEGRAAVMKKGKWGYINESGEQVIKPEYLTALDFNSGLAAVKPYFRDCWCIVTIEGKELYGSFDTIVRLDSFALGAKINFFRTNDTLFTIYHHSNTSGRLYGIDSIFRRGDFYILVYGDAFGSRDRETNYQVVDGRLNIKTDQFRADTQALRKTIAVRSNRNYREAVLTADAHISAWYDDVTPQPNGFWIVEKDAKYGALNSELKEIIPPQNKSVVMAGNHLIVTKEATQYVCDTNGRRVGKEFAGITYLGSGMFRVKNGTDQYARIMNPDGDTLPGRFFEVFGMSCGLMRVIDEENKHFGYLNKDGVLISGWHPRCVDYHEPHTYNDVGGTIFRIFMGIATAGISELFEPVRDMGGEKTVAANYTTDYGKGFENGYTYYTVARKSASPNTHEEELVYYGIIDSTGKVIVPAQYDEVKMIDTFFIVKKNDKVGVQSMQNKQILPVQYGEVHVVGNNFFSVTLTTPGLHHTALYRWNGVSGKFLTPFIYSDFKNGGDSVLIVEKWPELGYMDYTGKVFIRPTYSQAFPFENGKAKVSNQYTGGEFYIDRRGKKIE